MLISDELNNAIEKELEDFNNLLKEGVVEFEYLKRDGSVRKTKGTMNEEYLPEPLPDSIAFEKDVIDTLMEIKNINSIEDYAKDNGMKYSGIIEVNSVPSYLFTRIKPNPSYLFTHRKPKKNDEYIIYYDLEKNSFRSFFKYNFLGINR